MKLSSSGMQAQEESAHELLHEAGGRALQMNGAVKRITGLPVTFEQKAGYQRHAITIHRHRISMKVKVNNEEITLSCEGPTIEDLLKQMKVNRETVIVAVNNEISMEETLLAEGDDVRLLQVVSGG